MRRKTMRALIRELSAELEQEREKRHAAEVDCAAARGELRGYRSGVDVSARNVRSAARQGEAFHVA